MKERLWKGKRSSWACGWGACLLMDEEAVGLLSEKGRKRGLCPVRCTGRRGGAAVLSGAEKPRAVRREERAVRRLDVRRLGERAPGPASPPPAPGEGVEPSH